MNDIINSNELRQFVRESVNDGNIDGAIDSAVESAVDNAIENSDFCDEERVRDIAHDQAESYFDENIGDHTSDGDGEFDISIANSMLNQISQGTDCSDGQPFRNAVLTIINADKVKNGSKIDDGSDMAVHATGSDQQITAILNHRLEYFEALHSALVRLLGAAPNGSPVPTQSDERETWLQARKDHRSTFWNDYWREKDADDGSSGSEGRTEIELRVRTRERNQLWAVANEAVRLMGFLSALKAGMTGEDALRNAREWTGHASKLSSNHYSTRPDTSEI